VATEIGTATDHYDLYNKLYDFLTANTELVAANQQWTEVWSHADRVNPVVEPGTPSQFMLKAPGLAGNDNVYISFSLHDDQTADVQGFYMRAHDAPLDSSTVWDNHINTSPYVYTPMFSNQMPYWFVANGRRFVAVWKCSTIYEACSAGLFLPFSTPAGYPYPVYIGGSSETTIRFSEDRYTHTHFVDPGPRGKTADDATSNSTGGRSLVARSPSGTWPRFDNGQNTWGACTYPYASADITSSNFLHKSRELLGGGYLLTPITLTMNLGYDRGAMGALEGVYHVAGWAQAAENILTVGGVDHLVVQNAYRTDLEAYWALALQ